jgi:hypothetical protein
MKCDNCNGLYSHHGSQEQPYPEIGCMLGHWEGIDGPPVDEGPDPWADCVDFNPIRLTDCGGCVNLEPTPMLNLIVYSCGITGGVVPHHSQADQCNGQITEFLRVPMSCPRPDSEVIKTPYNEDLKP